MARSRLGFLAGYLFAGTSLLSVPALAGSGGSAVAIAHPNAWPGIVLAGNSACAAPAVQPSAGASAETWREACKLVEVNGLEQQMRGLLLATRSRVIAVIARANRQPEPEVAPIVDRPAIPAREKRLPDLLDRVAQVYATKFTADELQHIVQFDRSPVGKKLLATTPHMAAETARAAADWGERAVLKILREKEQELKAHGLKI